MLPKIQYLYIPLSLRLWKLRYWLMMYVNGRRKSRVPYLVLAGAGNNFFENSFTGLLPSDLGSIKSLSHSPYPSNFGLNFQNSWYVFKPRSFIWLLPTALIK